MSFARVCELLSSNERQNIEEAKRIIMNEMLYNAADESNNTLLHHASEVGNHEIVQFLVDSGCILDAWNHFGKTPLVSTLETRNPSKEVIEILLKAGAKILDLETIAKSAVEIINCSDWLSEDTTRFEIYKAFLAKAEDFDNFALLINGNEEMIEMLLQTNIDLSLTDSEGNTLVHTLAQNQNPGIMALLRGRNFDINARTTDGWTPLMNAAIHDAMSAVEFLLDEGADIEAVNNEKKTALYIAFEVIADSGDKDCIQLLLERGANVQIEVDSNSCPTILDLIVENQCLSTGSLAVAQLALQELKGVNITKLIYDKINSNSGFRTFFEQCKQQITKKIDGSVTILDILIASDRKLERYLRDKELASNVEAFKGARYFNTVLRKRFSKTISMIELRKKAALIIGKLMRISYARYPSIMDEIADYFEKEDLESLISIEN